jgi:nucleotide-binding universal stress UspA family protein
VTRSVRPAVVAGIDGSAAGWNAMEWAVTEAGARRLPLLVVHAVPAGLGPQAVRHAEVLLTDAVGRARGRGIDAEARLEPDGTPTGVDQAGSDVWAPAPR